MNSFEVKDLRTAISKEYAEVAAHPQKGFHCHTGHKLAVLLGYSDMWPESFLNELPALSPPVWVKCVAVEDAVKVEGHLSSCQVIEAVPWFRCRR